MCLYYLSLGSNAGSRILNLQKAFQCLQDANIDMLKTSSVYETKPVDLKEQPDFLNQVVKIKTKLFPVELLRATKKIEKVCGRKRIIRFGPRTLDVDILWWDGGSVKQKNLTVPHPRAAQRKFVLVPWMEIAGKNFILKEKPLYEWIKHIEKEGDVQVVKRYSH